jgi:endonuclease III
MSIGATTARTEASMSTATGGKIAQYPCVRVLNELDGGYSSALAINLASMESEEVFKWFLASVLFGARISEDIAMKTYKEFEKAGILCPRAILETGRQGLADILDRGGYIRYDFKTATKLLEIMRTLTDRYQGDLNRLHFFARDKEDLKDKLQNLGKGIGPVTVNIFLRELRGTWEKAEPPLSVPALLAARNLGLVQAANAAAALEELRTLWEANYQDELSLSSLETVLVRLGKNYCQKKRCLACPVKQECQTR